MVPGRLGTSVADPDLGCGAFCGPWLRDQEWVKTRVRDLDPG
jgi:hypothetical protein